MHTHIHIDTQDIIHILHTTHTHSLTQIQAHIDTQEIRVERYFHLSGLILSHTHSHTHSHAPTHTPTHTHSLTHTLTHTHTHTLTHSHTHTHTHSDSHSRTHGNY